VIFLDAEQQVSGVFVIVSFSKRGQMFFQQQSRERRLGIGQAQEKLAAMCESPLLQKSILSFQLRD
jgi:hypothetical protein